MEKFIPPAVAVLVTLAVTSGYKTALALLKERVRVRSPESADLEKVVPAVNALLEIQGPQTQALIALLEATQGKCNGNVDEALTQTRTAKTRFDTFLMESARVKGRPA